MFHSLCPVYLYVTQLQLIGSCQWISHRDVGDVLLRHPLQPPFFPLRLSLPLDLTFAHMASELEDPLGSSLEPKAGPDLRKTLSDDADTPSIARVLLGRWT